ncbi:uncharacterized protein LOC129959880 [Argiope bruennichi]|uniref:uncharacterized protein LOC129959880 n=1 Tax=Argiope bruennichi TaxID=94029 RepID=UPI0024955B60|nr:uncharacterized protein LOC129959880 [Argiope bruennichi]
MSIILTDDIPVTSPVRRLAPIEKQQVTKQIKEWLAQGIIEKSYSDYASPIVLVKPRPLSDLLRNGVKFEFGPSQIKAFETLKRALSQDPVLHLYKPGSKLELHTDASKLGYGGILLQADDDDNLHPIAYMSKKTTPQEENLSSYELEVLAVIKALTKFRTYILRTKIKIVTDCSAFKQTITKKELIPKIARWVLFLEDFDYEIVHRSGSQMRHVDSLSRYPTVMTALCDDLTARVQVAHMSDEYIKKLKELCKDNNQVDFVVQNNILYKCQDNRRLLEAVFGNPMRIITDKGSAFTSKEFTNYCANQNINHIQITTGIPRGNGQVERVHGTLIPLLAKLSINGPTKWYTHVQAAQRVFNSTAPRSTKFTPFELMIGVQMRHKNDQKILDILQEEYEQMVIDNHEDIREEARQNILRLQEENKRAYNKRRKKATQYNPGDLVAIQRTQFGSGLKLRPKFHGPYRITAKKPHQRYLVEKVGIHEGPNHTSTAADYMKP